MCMVHAMLNPIKDAVHQRSGVLDVRAIQRRSDRLKRIKEHGPASYVARKQLALPVPLGRPRPLSWHRPVLPAGAVPSLG